MHADPRLVDKLLAGDRCRPRSRPPLPRQFLADAVGLAERYARVEKLVLGGTRVSYSPAGLAVDLSPDGDAAAQGEALAAAERTRLALPAGPVMELEELIEGQGIKIIPRLFPSQVYAGAFFFDAALGPCILVHARASDSTMRYSLAHEYAHFLADYDPYIFTLCGLPTDEVVADPVELRAHHMALEFLMPRGEVEGYRTAMGLRRADAVSAELVRQLCVYFDLDAEVVFWRLLALEWIDAATLRGLLEADELLAGELRTVPEAHGLLPERFVRLVAGAFGRGKLDLGAAAEHLGTDVAEAEGILAQFDYADTTEADAGSRERATGAAPRASRGPAPAEPRPTKANGSARRRGDREAH